MKPRLAALPFALLLLPFHVSAEEQPLPVIDMHLHARGAPSPQRRLCLPVTVFGVVDPKCREPMLSPPTDRELLQETITILERRNVYGVISGYPLERVEHVERLATILRSGPES